ADGCGGRVVHVHRRVLAVRDRDATAAGGAVGRVALVKRGRAHRDVATRGRRATVAVHHDTRRLVLADRRLGRARLVHARGRVVHGDEATRRVRRTRARVRRRAAGDRQGAGGDRGTVRICHRRGAVG